MNSPASDRAVQRGFADHASLFIAVAAGALVAFAVLHYILMTYDALSAGNLPENAEFQFGDWLINYQSGIVRRGFIGQLLYFVSDRPNVILWTTLSLQCALYIGAYILTLKLFFAKKRSFTWCIFLFSPLFFIAFQFNDEVGAFRKEIIVYFALALYLFGLQIERRTVRLLAIAAYLTAALSHELCALCVVFFVWPIFEKIRGENRRDLWPELGAFCAIAGIGLALSVFFPGSSLVAKGICNALKAKGFDSHFCRGAIIWISRDTQFALEHVEFLKQFGYVVWPYIVAFFLGILPVFLLKKFQKPLIWMGLGLVAFSPLFYLAYDHGRWLSILFSLSFLNFFYMPSLKDDDIRHIPWWMILIYCLCWSVRHFLATTIDFGFIDPFVFALFGKM